MKSLFIVLEGIDGSGTSTQALLLKDYFLKNGGQAVISPEPTDGIIGKLLREAMQKKIIPIRNTKRFDEQMAYLFAADRHYHLYNDIDGIFKLIQDGVNVISTRYYFSSLAYNCHSTEDFKFVKRLNENFPNPDLVIYFDIPVEVSWQRLIDRASLDIYETEDKLRTVRENFERVFQDYSGAILKLDGSQPKDVIHQKIVDYIEKLKDREEEMQI
jgi:dTMP kinase